MEITMEKLGKKISELRDLRGMTQEGLSVKSKIARRTIQNVEGGQVMSPGIEVIWAIARALGVSVGELLGEKPSEAESKADLITKIITGLPALDYDELRTISSAIDDLASVSASSFKTASTK